MLFGGVIGERRHAADPRRLQQRGAAAPRRSSPANSRSNTRPFGASAPGRPAAQRLRPPRRRLGPRPRRQRRRARGRPPAPRGLGAAPGRTLRPRRHPGRDRADHRRQTATTTGYVQYGRSIEHVDSTVDRLWLFIAAGVLGGTLLASFAGVAIARRAMRPIASLTATAREIATTRDPSRRMPEPAVEDEVGELALTLEQMLRSLDAARAEREGAMQKQREFVADASHELRTPLTSVLANLELLQASLGGPGQAEDREVVDSALRSSRRMSRLVGDLLLLARADAGRLDKHRRCDLAEVAGDAAAEAAPLMGDRPLDRRQRPAAAGRRQPRRAAPDGPQPARQRRPPHPGRGDDRTQPARGGRRRGGRGRRRRPRHPRRDARARSSTASSAARARPTPPAAPAPASAWRSSAPSPPPTAAASRPWSRNPAAPSSAPASPCADSEQVVTEPLKTL